MITDAFIQPQRELPTTTLRCTLLVEGADECRRIAHELIVDGDGFATCISVDIADANRCTNITSKERIGTIRASGILPRHRRCAGDKLEPMITRGIIVDTEISNKDRTGVRYGNGICRQRMVLVLTDVIFARCRGFAEEYIRIEVGEDTCYLCFARDLPLAAGNVDRIAKLRIQLFDLKREVNAELS